MATASGLGLLALALVGGTPTQAPAPPPSESKDGAVAVQVRVFDMDGLGWRTAFGSKIQRIANRGTATIWTADAALLKDIAAKAHAADAIPPRDINEECYVSRTKQVSYVSHVDHKGTSVVPTRTTMETGLEARICGRKLEQGFLADVALAETRLVGMHTVRVEPPATDSCCAEKAKDEACDVAVAGDKAACTANRIAAMLQVPEVVETEVEGEWLIPDHGILVVSLGVDTVADPSGRAVVRERLATIEVGTELPPAPVAVSQLNGGPKGEPITLARDDLRETPGAIGIPSHRELNVVIGDATPRTRMPAGTLTPSRATIAKMGQILDQGVARTDFEVVGAPTPVPVVNPVLPTPSAPSRSLPVAVDAEGKVIEPPADRPTLDSSVQTASNQPSPQTPPFVVTTFDPALAQATFVSPAPGVTTRKVESSWTSAEPRTLGDVVIPQHRVVSATIGEALRTPGRTETVRIPLFGRIALEVQAKVVATPTAPAVADAQAAPKD